MFDTKNYKVWFKRRSGIQLRRDGFDTMCNICRSDGHFLAADIAWLHPKDKYDKITGKKVALTKALVRYPGMFNKQQRTEIWWGFWEWVRSWKEKRSKNEQ